MRFVTRDVSGRFKQCYFEDALIAARGTRIYVNTWSFETLKESWRLI